MLIPLRTDSPLRTTPYMNWALIVANVAVYVLQATNPAIIDHYMLWPRYPRVYAFITSTFLHAGLLHIAGNMLFLYIFGNNVNDRMGHLGYLAFYLAGGIAGNIAYVLTQHEASPVLGASGAISAVTGAYLVLFPRSSITVFYFWFFFGQIEIPSLWFIGGFFAYDIFLQAAEHTAGGGGVAHMAHVGGTVFGFGLCFALLAVSLLPRDQFDIVALVQRWNKRRQYRDLVSKG